MGLLLGDGIGTHETAHPAARRRRGAGARTGSTGRTDLVPDGVMVSGKRKLGVILECGLRMDNDEGAIEERALQKTAKYRSARVQLRAGMRQDKGSEWHVTHVSFIAGWKTSMNEAKWAANLATLGIPPAKHDKILQRAAEAVLKAFGSLSDALMGAGGSDIT
eukprot:3291753-Rhodomonas_salina.2